jgi:hypothetical protein
MASCRIRFQKAPVCLRTLQPAGNCGYNSINNEEQTDAESGMGTPDYRSPTASSSRSSSSSPVNEEKQDDLEMPPSPRPQGHLQHRLELPPKPPRNSSSYGSNRQFSIEGISRLTPQVPPPVPRRKWPFDSQKFLEYNQNYVKQQCFGPEMNFCSLELCHADQATTIPDVAERLSQIPQLFRSQEFQQYLPDDMELPDLKLKAITLIAILRLIDNRVRSSVIFSRQPEIMWWLTGVHGNAVFDDAAILAVRELLNEHWREMFQDLLKSPQIVYEQVSGELLLTQIDSIMRLHSVEDVDAASVAKNIPLAFSVLQESMPQLVELILIICLGPQQAAFADQPLVCTSDIGNRRGRVIQENKYGSIYATVLIFPEIVIRSSNLDIGDGALVYLFRRFHKETYLLFNQSFITANSQAAICRADLGPGDRNIASDLPHLQEKIRHIEGFFNNDAFQEFLPSTANFGCVMLRAITLITIIRLIDNRVRSSAIFSRDSKVVGRLIGYHPKAARRLVDAHWRELFEDLLESPELVYEGVDNSILRGQVESIMRCYRVEDIDVDTVVGSIPSVFAWLQDSMAQLVEIVLSICLSPQQAAFADRPLVNRSNLDSLSFHIFEENGRGSLFATVLLFPQVVRKAQAGPAGEVKLHSVNKPFEFAFRR